MKSLLLVLVGVLVGCGKEDGKRLATTPLTGSLARELGKIKSFKNIKWGKGIYGPFGGTSIKGKINVQ